LLLTGAIAAIGLGNSVSTAGQRVRGGFLQAKGVHIAGTPAN